MKSNPTNYQPGDFIVHFGGQDKLARIDSFLAARSALSHRRDKAECMKSTVHSELSDRYFIYRQAGRSAYPIRLRGDGTIDGGRQGERQWKLEWHGDRPSLTLVSESQTICHLSDGEGGSWTGAESGNPPVRHELIPHRAQMLVDKLKTRPGRMLGAEIGVSTGDTSVILLQSLPQMTLVMVDAWQAARQGDRWWQTGDPYAKLTQEEMDERMMTAIRRTRFAGHRRMLLICGHAPAAAIAPDGLGFVFLDAEHSCEGTLEAMRAWWPKLAPDGLMAGHDYGHPDYPGVARAVHEFAGRHDLMVHAAPDFVWYLERPT